MKFLAIDTSGKYLTVAAYRDGEAYRTYLPDCATKHSVALMDEIDGIFERAKMTARECGFFAAVTGPGSFTGIRIGISTVKGLCLACNAPALSITSFDCLAYAEKNIPLVALVDAGHGFYYSCAYDGEKRVAVAPAYRSQEEVRGIVKDGYLPVAAEELFEGCARVNPGDGLVPAVLAKSGKKIPATEISALYLRRSSAEENAK